MNKDYNKKKKITIAALTVAAVCLAGGLCYYMSILNHNEPPASPAESEPASKVEILVPEISTEGNSESTEPTESKGEETQTTIPGAGATETPVATVPGNVQAKPSDGKPKSPSEATPPAEAPSESDIVPEEHPAGEPEHTPQPEAGQPQSGDKQDGKIYVPGFGWIEDNGGGSDVQIAPNAGTGDPIGEM